MDQVLVPDRTEGPLNGPELRAQVNIIQQTMKAVMKSGEHYGVVPGCGNKPTLLKPGAEKLMSTFRLAADPEVLELFPGEDGKVGYRVTCRITSMMTGRFLGSGIGECTSEEDKFKWRRSICDEEFDDRDDPDRRKKYSRDGSSIKQVKTNPFDLSNTILKMAKKRALVDAVLTVCAASDIFAQDLEEDSTKELVINDGDHPKHLPQGKWNAGLLANFEVKQGQTGKKSWKRRILTFQLEDESVFEISALHLPEGWDDETLNDYVGSDNYLAFQWDTNQKGYMELTALAPTEPESQPT